MRLRGEQMKGFRFRRQVPMGPYVLDFACLKARLVIEVDGGQLSAVEENLVAVIGTHEAKSAVGNDFLDSASHGGLR